MTSQELERRILNDMRVELTEEFDRNFSRKGFFGKKWKPRRNIKALGSLLHVTGALRRSIQGRVEGHGVRFTSSVPYALVHNEGGRINQYIRAHNRRTRSGKTAQVRAHQRTLNMPQRQFVGDSPEVRSIIENVIGENLSRWQQDLNKHLKQ